MKKIDLTNGIAAALLFVSPMIGAETRDQADFEPVILYQDAELIAKSGGKPSASANATTTSKPAVSAAVEQRKPAATASGAESAGQLVSQNFMIILIAAGLGGFIFWSSKRSAAPVSKAVQSAPVAQAGEASSAATGVARYLESVNGSAGSASATAVAAATGVAKYLKSLEGTAKAVAAAPVVTAAASAATVAATATMTGVAKYLKNLESSAKATVAATGVAKYLANLDK